MMTFSINKSIEPSVATLLWHEINKNTGMIVKVLSLVYSSTAANKTNKKTKNEILKEQLDSLKEEIYFKSISNFKVSSANPELSTEEKVEHYIKSTIKNTLKDVVGNKSMDTPIDLDLLDGHGGSSDEDYDWELNRVRRKVVSNNEKVSSTLEYSITLEETRRVIAEIYLTDRRLFNTIDELVQYCSTSAGGKLKLDEVKYLRSRKTDSLILRFFECLRDVHMPDVEAICREYKKYDANSITTDKVKEIIIKSYPFYQYSELDGLYSGIIQNSSNKTFKFDVQNCYIGNVEMETGVCSLLNSSGSKVFRIRIEDFIDYISYNTLVEEGVSTPLLHWLKEYYMYTLPSGQNVAFCCDPSEYQKMVKQELLINLLKNGVNGIFAMNDTYVYFTPKCKPKFSKIVCKLYNGKEIQMKVEAVNNVFIKGRQK